MHKNILKIALIITSLIIFSIPLVANAKENNTVSSTTILSTEAIEEITALLENYSDYLSSRTKNLIDPSITNLLDERLSFYTELVNVGLNSKLKGITSEFNIESMEISEIGNVYHVKIVETVTLAGKYKLDRADNYPVIKAARWALARTTDQKVKRGIEGLIGMQTGDVEKSLNNGNGFETGLILSHEIVITKTDKGLKIVGDTFDDKGPENPEGIDVVNWTSKALERSKPDFTKMPDYKLNHTALNVLGQEILKSYIIQNDISPTPTVNAKFTSYIPNYGFLSMTYAQPTATIQYSGMSLISYNPKNGFSPTDRRLQFNYFRTTAINYINTYTSNTTNTCGGSVFQNLSKYNTAQYTTQGCNDCVNFVSQALKAGGVPTDNAWKPYTYAWINVTGLVNHLKSTNKAIDKVTCSTSNGGDIAYLPDMSHVVMISAIAPVRYSGHTNDRYKYTWNSSFVCMRING